MLLSKYTPANFFSIREPRYRDKVVLLKAKKISAHNKIVFTDSPSMGIAPYYISGKEANKCSIENMPTRAGGVVRMRAVPIDKLEQLEYTKRDILEVM